MRAKHRDASAGCLNWTGRTQTDGLGAGSADFEGAEGRRESLGVLCLPIPQGGPVSGSSSRDPPPFPRVVESVCAAAAARGGAREAAVRSWAAFPEHQVLVLNMHRNRWCENVGREHKSNNVLFVVDFKLMVCETGVRWAGTRPAVSVLTLSDRKHAPEGAFGRGLRAVSSPRLRASPLSQGFYQRCHDPECADFRGDMRPLDTALREEARESGTCCVCNSPNVGVEPAAGDTTAPATACLFSQAAIFERLASEAGSAALVQHPAADDRHGITGRAHDSAQRQTDRGGPSATLPTQQQRPASVIGWGLSAAAEEEEERFWAQLPDGWDAGLP